MNVKQLQRPFALRSLPNSTQVFSYARDSAFWMGRAWAEVAVDVLWFWQEKIFVYFTHADEATLVKQDLDRAETFDDWELTAERLDALLGNDIWRQNPASKHYDYKLISGRLKQILQARQESDVPALIELLRSGLLRNLGSITSPALYNRAYSGTKLLIENYVNEVVAALEYIDDQPASVITDQQRRDFYHDIRQSFGQSSLVLHGGSLFGLCHLGTVKALQMSGLLPSIISGTTVGAIVAALVCSCTDDELLPVIDGVAAALPPLSQEYTDLKFSSVVEGVISSLYPPEIIVFEQYVRARLGNMTFEEAYLKSDKILNIIVTPAIQGLDDHSLSEIPTLLNYLSAPTVLIWSAVRASVGSGILPGDVQLLAKNHLGEIVPYVDGDVKFEPSNKSTYNKRRDSPYTRLSELFNVNNFIVSLARPYFAPFLVSDLKYRGHKGWRLQLLKLFRIEVQHRLDQFSQLGLLPDIIKRMFIDENIPGGFQATIVPELPEFVRDFAKVFDSHNIEDKVNYWIWVGQRSVWPMMTLIWSRSAIEIILNNIYMQKERATM